MLTRKVNVVIEGGCGQNSLQERPPLTQPGDDVPFGSPNEIPTPSAPEQPVAETSSGVFVTGSMDLDKMQRDLAPYIAQAHKLIDVREHTAPQILGTLSEGLAKTSIYMAKAKVRANMTRAERKHVTSRVIINEFPVWIKNIEGGKATDKMREMFSDQHSLVLRAKQEEADAEAIYEFLLNIKMLLTMSLSSAKAIAYGHKDSFSVGGNNYTGAKDD